jgi:diguanylate cyclase (GGDEF)-like protein/PAS domain S-box-containing protein
MTIGTARQLLKVGLEVTMVMTNVTGQQQPTTARSTDARRGGLTADQLGILQSISADVAAAVDPTSLAEHVVSELHARFGYEMPSVYLLQKDGSLALAAQIGYAEPYLVVPAGQGVIGQVLREASPVLVRDVDAVPEFQFAEPDVLGEVCVPILSAGQVVGVVNVETRRQGVFDERDIALLELLARLMAVALRNAESQRSLSTLLGNLPGMAYRCRNDPAWTTEFVSNGCLELTGFPAEELLSHRVSYGDLIEPADRERLWDDTQAALRSKRPFQQIYRIQTASGVEKWVWEQGCGVLDAQGEVVALEGFVTDITERRQAEEALAASEAQYRQMFEQNRAIQLLLEPSSGHIVEANQAACEFYGFSVDEMRTKTLDDINLLSRDEVATEMARAVAQQRSYFVFRHRVASGLIRDVEVHSGPVNIRGRELLYSIIHDITERKRAEEALEHQALHDGLTGLPNRLLLQDRLTQAIRMAERDGRTFALCVIDLDRFKDVNDTLGHLAGDQLLQEVAWRLRNALRASDTVARLGGDEFAVVLPDADMSAATLAAEKIVEALGASLVLEGHEVAVGASVGIAVYPENGGDSDTLLRRADVAMYVAKQTRGGYVVYAPDQDQSSSQRLTLVGALRRAIADDELTLYYQPKVDCRSGAVAGVEALVRWQHPLQGLILPDRFIPLAEQTGLIRPLTRWVLNAAVRQTREWHDAGLMLSVAVNLSAHDLQDPELPKRVAELLAQWAVDAEWLKLELTESALMADPTQSLQVLTELCNLGVRIAIDDFGTGYSSLGYLKHLPAHEIKIDRSFVADMAGEARDHAIVRSTIDLGHNLGLSAVAEGVEDQRTLELLSGLGCDLAQGYFLSRPLPASSVAEWCRNRAGAPDRLAA